MGIAVWGLLTLGDGRTLRETSPVHVWDIEVPEWLLTGPGDAGVVAKPMPPKRMKGQQAPPCGASPTQVLLNEACWVALDAQPPCGDFYEYEGRCYVPVVERRRLPTSATE
ncbi:hypothetical protein [Melittangium boletus]|uniref:hypothetical protein n=1 Tax=Melittangium boletus TaxID=83453 RepID=UPI003DA5AF05